MPFTDDDLKRLKEATQVMDYFKSTGFDIESLLARLEAESSCAELLQLHYDSGVFDDLDEGDVALIVQALEARHKAAGK